MDGELLLTDAGSEYGTLRKWYYQNLSSYFGKFSGSKRDLSISPLTSLKESSEHVGILKGSTLVSTQRPWLMFLLMGLIDLKIFRPKKKLEKTSKLLPGRFAIGLAWCSWPSALGLEEEKYSEFEKEGMVFTIEPGLYFP